MSSLQDLKMDFDWKFLKVSPEDLKHQDRGTLLLMLQQIYLIRRFESLLLQLKKKDLIHGPVHTSMGQEAVAVGAIGAIRSTDVIGGTHRAHHQFLAKALSFYTPPDYNPQADSFPVPMQEAVNRLLAEIMGLSPGYCGGRGGSMHLCAQEIGVLGTDAIVGGGIPLATGVAWARRYRKRDDIVISFLGDGAVNQGSFHEALNLAGLWNLPIIYVIENNLYAVATHLNESVPIPRLSQRAASYGMKARIVDGMDPVAVKLVVEEAVKDLRSGSSPYIIEALTYRFFHHAGDIPGSAFGYRTRDEEGEWRQRDPVETFPRQLRQSGILSEEEDERIREIVDQVIRRAEECYLDEDTVSGKKVIKTSFLPERESLTAGLHSDGREFEKVEFVKAEDLLSNKKMKYVEAVAAVTGRWLEKDSRVFVMGEEVGHFGGGAYQATAGLPQKYPGRIWDTPISEAGFSGLACGAAMSGCRPIVEIMFPDFVLVAADQIFNQIGKLRYIYGGKVDIPLVMRTRIAIGCGYGGQHSLDPVALFSLFPGWRIVAPATAFDYIGLFNSAMQSRDPVLIVEHHLLYNQTGMVPADNDDYYIEMGKAKVVIRGGDITVLSYSSTVSLSEQVARKLLEEGIEAEVIDLRTLDLAHIDYETIGQSLQRTGRMVIVEQAPRSNSLGGHIAGTCQERFFDSLDAPIARVAGADVPMPVSRLLESAALPTVQSVKEAIHKAIL
jgi:2-oxoisovalerate dehydrogenase E1 component